MPGPNTNFTLTVDDLDMIETALRTRKASLAERLADVKNSDEDLKDSVHSIHELLGRLHNQKEFYRPTSGVFVSG